MSDAVRRLPKSAQTDLIRILAYLESLKPQKIVLFGSAVWGEFTKDSDLDLFVVQETDKDWFTRTVDAQRHLPNKNTPLDLLINTPSEVAEAVRKRNPFYEQILREGVVLYESQR